ncbi:MAG: heme-binding protein [Lysobacterales bacterium]
MNARLGSLMLLLSLSALPAENTMATEQVPYQVEQTLADQAEVRRYDSVIVAETIVDEGDFRDAGNAGFRRLANYIFGGNQDRQKIAMTAPVAMAPELATYPSAADRISSGPHGEGRWRMSFYMPADSQLATLPRPTDPRVELRSVAPRRVAAIRFSGRGTPAQFARAESSLKQLLTAAGLSTQGMPWTARYNAPWVLPPFRRNEVLIELAPE